MRQPAALHRKVPQAEGSTRDYLRVAFRSKPSRIDAADAWGIVGV